MERVIPPRKKQINGKTAAFHSHPGPDERVSAAAQRHALNNLIFLDYQVSNAQVSEGRRGQVDFVVQALSNAPVSGLRLPYFADTSTAVMSFVSLAKW